MSLASHPKKEKPRSPATAAKLSYKEKQELETLELMIAQLEAEKAEIENALSSGVLSPSELSEKSERFAIILREIGMKSDRWLELSEKEQES